MNKKFGFFLILGVAFFSLLTCPATYATDTLPTKDNQIISLDNVEGWRRSSSYGVDTSLYASCRWSQDGMLLSFPLSFAGNTEDTLISSPCGYIFSNGELSGPFNRDYHYRYEYSFNSSGRSISNPVWNSTLLNNLGNSSYHASSYVSISDTFRPKGHYHFNNTGGSTYNAPVSDEDGFDFIAMTIENASLYRTTRFPSILYKNASISVDNTPGNGSHTADEIRGLINYSSYVGWVWTDSDGHKQSTLVHDGCSENVNGTHVECDTTNNIVIPEGETFRPLQDYLDQLPDDTFFLLVGLPKFADASYRIDNFYFWTPDTMADYGYNFDSLTHPEFYFGEPSLYSPNYENNYLGTPRVDVLYQESYSVYNTTLFITPTTPEAYARSRSFYYALTQDQMNVFRFMNGLYAIDPNPGGSFWSNIFNLSNLFFPFRNFFSGFTASQCVAIPTLAGMLNLPSNQQYCTWWASGTRAVLTPIFNVASMMLLFGFVMHWFRKDNTDTLKEKG